MIIRLYSKGFLYLIIRVGFLIFFEISVFEKRRCLIFMDDDFFVL